MPGTGARPRAREEGVQLCTVDKYLCSRMVLHGDLPPSQHVNLLCFSRELDYFKHFSLGVRMGSGLRALSLKSTRIRFNSRSASDKLCDLG